MLIETAPRRIDLENPDGKTSILSSSVNISSPLKSSADFNSTGGKEMGLLQNSSLLIQVRRTSERDIEAKHVGKVGTRGYLSLGD